MDRLKYLDVMRTGRILKTVLERRLSGMDIHGGQSRVLHHLESGQPVSQESLARKLKVKPPTLSAILKKMESRGLISRIRSTEDSRVVHVCLTIRGEEFRRRILQVFEDLDAEIRKCAGDEAPQFAETLSRIRLHFAPAAGFHGEKDVR